MKLIVATDLCGGIGHNGSIPWRCRRDLAHFKEKTLGQTLVMGRKTVESLPFKLKDRKVIMLSTGEQNHKNADFVFRSWIDLEKSYNLDDLWVCGGSRLYWRAMINDTVDEVWLTTIIGVHRCDSYFEGMNLLCNFDKVSVKFYPEEDEDPAFTICHFVRR